MKPRRPIRRKTPIKRSTKRIKLRRGDPAKRRWASRRDPGYCAWIRTHPCLLANHTLGFGGTGIIACGGRLECAHVKARGAGGDDVANTVPLCTSHHRQLHNRGTLTFQKLYSINLENKALYYGAIQPPKRERDYPELYGGAA